MAVRNPMSGHAAALGMIEPHISRAREGMGRRAERWLPQHGGSTITTRP